MWSLIYQIPYSMMSFQLMPQAKLSLNHTIQYLTIVGNDTITINDINCHNLYQHMTCSLMVMPVLYSRVMYSKLCKYDYVAKISIYVNMSEWSSQCYSCVSHWLGFFLLFFSLGFNWSQCTNIEVALGYCCWVVSSKSDGQWHLISHSVTTTVLMLH